MHEGEFSACQFLCRGFTMHSSQSSLQFAHGCPLIATSHRILRARHTRQAFAARFRILPSRVRATAVFIFSISCCCDRYSAAILMQCWAEWCLGDDHLIQLAGSPPYCSMEPLEKAGLGSSVGYGGMCRSCRRRFYSMRDVMCLLMAQPKYSYAN